MTVQVELRCPQDARRMFGKTDPGASGTVAVRCRDCRRKRMDDDPEWHGHIVHTFDLATGECVNTAILTGTVRPR